MMEFPKADRLLIQVELEPVQGSRFQPTGFPNLGSAEFIGYDHDGHSTKSVLVESAQSMANRLEKVCLNDNGENFVDVLSGLPMITVTDDKGRFLTNSLVEAHRMASSYMLESEDKRLFDKIKDLHKGDSVNINEFAQFVFNHDPNSLLHGVFVAKSDLAGGRYKLTRSISAFVEATNVTAAVSGGVKLDRVDPKGGGDEAAKTGFGHIPYSRTEYTAESIIAYFNLDLALIRSYHLGDDANNLLITFALWKIQKLLSSGLRFRTACDLQIKKQAIVTYPSNFEILSLNQLNKEIISAIEKCRATFDPISIKYTKTKTKKVVD